MTSLDAQRLRDLLRHVRWPGFDDDIVAAGFVPDIQIIGRDRVHVHFAPRTRRPDKVAAMVAEIERVLAAAPGVAGVDVEVLPPPSLPVLSQGGAGPEPDPMLLARAGVDQEDREPRWDGGRPDGTPRATRYEGPVPVHQWDIDPTSRAGVRGEAHVTLGDWEYRMWWQLHPSGLAYVSIQAIEDDTAGDPLVARPHPVGRAVAVNLVYDHRRAAIVAIYGTARDFRPFVEAFRRCYGLAGEESEK